MRYPVACPVPPIMFKRPTYLNLNRVKKEESPEDMNLSEEEFFDDDEYMDKELEILVGEEDSDTEGEIDFAEEDQAGVAAFAKDDAGGRRRRDRIRLQSV